MKKSTIIKCWDWHISDLEREIYEYEKFMFLDDVCQKELQEKKDILARVIKDKEHFFPVLDRLSDKEKEEQEERELIAELHELISNSKTTH